MTALYRKVFCPFFTSVDDTACLPLSSPSELSKRGYDSGHSLDVCRAESHARFQQRLQSSAKLSSKSPAPFKGRHRTQDSTISENRELKHSGIFTQVMSPHAIPWFSGLISQSCSQVGLSSCTLTPWFAVQCAASRSSASSEPSVVSLRALPCTIPLPYTTPCDSSALHHSSLALPVGSKSHAQTSCCGGHRYLAVVNTNLAISSPLLFPTVASGLNMALLKVHLHLPSIFHRAASLRVTQSPRSAQFVVLFPSVLCQYYSIRQN